MKLLEPAQLGTLTLPNRVVMAPMTRSRAPGTVPTPLMAEYYAQRATAGLIITEATQVSPSAQGYPDTPGLHTREQIEAWRAVTDAVHAAGGRIFAQLWHVGRISHSSYQNGQAPIAPSAVRPVGQLYTHGGLVDFETPRALETAEIAGLIEDFRQAAKNALQAGFDGVEIHGANGYLLDQFLESGTNQRSDQYGGSVENRARLLLEVTEAVSGAIGADRVGLRLSPGGTFNDMSDADPAETFSYVARALNSFGLAYLHVVETSQSNAPQGMRGHSPTALLREHFQGTLITAGGYERDSAERALKAGQADLVAFARAYIANPDLVERFRRGAPIAEPEAQTMYGGGEQGYTSYPTLEAQKATGTGI
ncbi:alkene reductase [Deinococcus peraridilitoris]|uniref:NADH:flavin oxidoreductase n=1 Tax=Deinococcus peraridilitoris (strain DSM 19664 / LMG 22246 / CIP 109416 / KR-200) TaxID=937777 RepID=K9ZYW9_DEIPD|nr:alkene reductase [Deinococcus peraridilitoris]AFZ66848.1 NADH:flavin oxidoreductase [Deinococcus peraridilitoris DSM 19664]